jgi:hypothetical protein
MIALNHAGRNLKPALHMKLKSFIESGKLDWSDLYFSATDGTGHYCPFTIKPTDFITFAKADFYSPDMDSPDLRGLVNALSNAKRAIDCQADSFIIAIGLDPENLSKQLGEHGMKSLVFGGKRIEGPLKFRFLEALGVATPSIVARMRQLRNVLEHEYKKPTRMSVSDAIGVADLFVQACGGKMKSMYDGVGFGSGVTTVHGLRQIAKNFFIRYRTEPNPRFEIGFWSDDQAAGRTRRELRIDPQDTDFVPLLKLICQADYDRDMTENVRCFLREIGFRISPKLRIEEF